MLIPKHVCNGNWKIRQTFLLREGKKDSRNVICSEFHPWDKISLGAPENNKKRTGTAFSGTQPQRLETSGESKGTKGAEIEPPCNLHLSRRRVRGNL